MRIANAAVLFIACVGSCSAAEVASGRWQGFAHIPGRELELIVDMAPDGQGAWRGSIIIPGMSIRGAPLADVVVADGQASFAIASALGPPEAGQAKCQGAVDAAGTMTGTFSQAGNTAPLTLTRIGPAQVEVPAVSTPVQVAIVGKWVGEFELGGYPRNVTITLNNRGESGAAAEFVVVGKKTTNVVVDRVTQEGDLLRLDSSTMGINFEGTPRARATTIEGVVELGALEIPLTLHREKAAQP